MTVQEFFEGARSHACREGREWAFENCKTLRDGWEKCQKGEWMLWMLDALKIHNPIIQRFQVKMLREQPCGGKVLWDLLTDKRSRAAVDMLEMFLDGKATQGELAAARAAAWDEYAAMFNEMVEQAFAEVKP